MSHICTAAPARLKRWAVEYVYITARSRAEEHQIDSDWSEFTTAGGGIDQEPTPSSVSVLAGLRASGLAALNI